MITKNNDHVQQALAKRIEQFKTKIRFGNLLTSYVSEVQSVEDALFQILDDTNLDTSVGQQLDNIGEIVGEPRNGRSDALYGVAIRARILLNTSEGTIEDIILLILALQSGLEVEILEFFPAAFLAQVNTPVDPDLIDTDQISNIISEGKPVGVRGLAQFSVAGAKQFDTADVGFDEGKFAVVLEG